MAKRDNNNVIHLPPPKGHGGEVVACLLEIIRHENGSVVMVRVATEMTVAASSIIAREDGPEAALRVLKGAACVLPEQRQR